MANIEIDWSRCATVPRQHQKDGVIALLKNPSFLLADQVGAGKSKQCVDTSQILVEYKQINTVLVLAPAFARSVWASKDPALGEVAKHGWSSILNDIHEYSVKTHPPKKGVYPQIKIERREGALTWLVSNYEFIRKDERLGPLLTWLANTKFWLICDEAWALKDAKSDQWKAVNKIRKMAARITLLNGTPIADDPLDMFAQMKLLDPYHKAQPIKYYSHFRNYYAVLKPNVSFPMITGWQHLDELSKRCAPFILQRQTRDCFDLPPILEPVLIEAPLTDENWKIYKQMRDEMVAWLSIAEDGSGGIGSVAKQAIVKSMRLAQITSGFLGGIQKIDFSQDMLDFGGLTDQERQDMVSEYTVMEPPREIGTEKLDATIAWLKRLKPTPRRLLIWCRFRLEVERTAAAIAKGGRRMHMLYGSQNVDERAAAVAALNPDIEQPGYVGVVGNPLAGGAALNLAGAGLAITMSHDTKLRVYLQARGRIDRPGQRNESICYVDVVATGPKGQRTIDHHILSALRGKEDVANWTAADWRQKLLAE